MQWMAGLPDRPAIPIFVHVAEKTGTSSDGMPIEGLRETMV